MSNWLSARAFTECGGINRRSKHAWTFRAWPPKGWPPDQSLSFSSGIIIAPAVGQNSKKAKVVAATRSVWGATPLPTPKEAAAAPDSAKKPTPAKAKARAGKARAAEQPGAKPTVAAAAARTEDGPEVATEAAATPVPADVPTGAQEDTSMNVPVHVALENTFEVIPNGGSGDCAYLAIAMAQADKDGCDLTAERFALGGTKQRNLRGMVAKEIMKNPACYPKARLKEALSMAGKDPELYALRMSMDGVSADGTILQAIAQIYNCELRIWKVTNEAPEGQPADWQPHLFIIRPLVAGRTRGAPSVVWLLLKNKHYEYLRLKDGIVPPSNWLDDATLWTSTLEAACPDEEAQVEATQVEAMSQDTERVDVTQLDPATQLDPCPEPKRRRASQASDPFEGGGKSIAPDCRSMGTASLRRALSLSSAPHSVGRIPNRPPQQAHTSRKSVSSSAKRRGCGITNYAASWGRQHDRPIGEVGNDVAAWAYCPCGWKPPRNVHSSVRQAKTKTHWRVCQGQPPPKPDAATWKDWRDQHLAAVRGGIEHRRRDRAQARFVAWKAGLPHNAAATACTPCLDVAFRGAYGQTLYKCTICGNERTLCNFRIRPCANHGAGDEVRIRPAQFQKLAGTWSRTAADYTKSRTDQRRLRYLSYGRARRQYLHKCKRDQVTPLQYSHWKAGHSGDAAQAAL